VCVPAAFSDIGAAAGASAGGIGGRGTAIPALLQHATTHVDFWEHLRRLWEYILLALSGIITEEATPLIGGLRAYTGHLRLSAVVVWIAAGTWGAHILLYWIGRWHGDWVRRRFPNARALILRVFRVVRRHPWRASLAVRFAWGLRLTLPIACGAARVPLSIYAIGSGISAAVWSLLFTLLGWALGNTTLIILGRVRAYEKWITVGIVVLAVYGFFAIRRRHMEEEVVDVLGKGDEEEGSEER